MTRANTARRIISLGGSIISPRDGQPNYTLLRAFLDILREYHTRGMRFAIVTGGGNLARTYQGRYKEMSDTPDPQHLDAIGIRATHVHAQFIGTLCASIAPTTVLAPEIGSDPQTIAAGTDDSDFVITGGCKYNVSTDYIAVQLAKYYNCREIINISDVAFVYDCDPRTHSGAKPVDALRWSEYLQIVGETWEPGGHKPFDPTASTAAQHGHIAVQFIAADPDSLRGALDNRPVPGTRISDDIG